MGKQNRSIMVANFFDSRVIKIHAGTERQIFRVHLNALTSSESPSLRASVSERWNAEKANRIIDWSDWDPSTVRRFINWLYTRSFEIPIPQKIHKEQTSATESATSDAGDVQLEQTQAASVPADSDFHIHSQDLEREPEPEPEPDVPVPEPEPGIALDEEPRPGTPLNDVGPRLSDDDNPEVQAVLLEAFHDRPLTPLSQCIPSRKEAIETADSLFAIKDYPHEKFRYRESLLVVAHLHAFAVYHLCKSLQADTAERMVDMLQEMDCSHPHASEDLKDSIDYVYANIPAKTPNNLSLRKVLSQFVAINYGSLIHNGFDRFIFRGDDFTVDVSKKLGQQLLAVNQSNITLTRNNDDLNTRTKKQSKKIKKLESIIAKCSKCRSKNREEGLDAEPINGSPAVEDGEWAGWTMRQR